MPFIKATTLSALILSAAAVTATAQDDPAGGPAARPQLAVNPGVPYSPTRMPGPKVGPTTWIPSAAATARPAPANPAATEEGGSYYSGKGFGPKPN